MEPTKNLGVEQRLSRWMFELKSGWRRAAGSGCGKQGRAVVQSGP